MAGNMFAEVFGKKDKSVPVDDLINRIDTAIDNLNVTSDISTDTEDALITKSITDLLVPSDDGKKFDDPQTNSMINTAGLDGIFKDLTVPNERLKKYVVYDTIYSNVQIIKKIITVYLDNIFQKDSISNKVLLIKEVDKDKTIGNIDEYKKFAERFIEFFDMQDRLRNSIFKSLKYGDSYIEYINLDDVEDKFPKVRESDVKKINPAVQQDDTMIHADSFSGGSPQATVITESQMETIMMKVKSKTPNGNKLVLDGLDIDKLTSAVFEFEDKFVREPTDVGFNFEADEDSPAKKVRDQKTKAERLVTKGGKVKKADPKKGSNLNGILLRYHSPHKIIPLVSDYDNILGYVEVKSIDKTGTPTYNPTLGFIDIVKKVSTLRSGKDSKQNYDKTLKLFSNAITKKIIAKYKIFYDPEHGESDLTRKKKEEEYQKNVKGTLDEEIYYSLKRILLDSGMNTLFHKKLAVRFIPVDRMFKFPISNSSSYPFGESIIDPLIYPAKLYLLTQLSNIVTKLSRSSIIRKWTVNQNLAVVKSCEFSGSLSII